MPLQIGGAGTGRPYAKFNAKSDKWFVRGIDGADAEIQRPTFVIDLDNIATGWTRFREGQAPERVMDASLTQSAPSPGEGFKRGFMVLTFSTKYFGGIAEFAATSVHVSNAIKDVYAEYEAQKVNHPGQVPVIACTGSEPIKDRHGTNYRPTFKVMQWVARPAELPNHSPVDPADVWHGNAGDVSSAAKAPAQHVPPPPALAAKTATDPLSGPIF
jgi:hypothetical protein